ncbi:DUF3800 domain-containing protein [Virgibacillus sediminis]|uniref:DUF3800 domain-containing protein n=1 Tax=Virgibacillus sediminis TaxID=202260 RepID=A0ABV7A5Z6_9BACI
MNNYSNQWKIFCEESGDKGIPRSAGSSHFYIITAILVRAEDAEKFRSSIEEHTFKELRLRQPLEWKQLKSRFKRDDKRISKFLRRVERDSPEFLITNVFCNKEETNGPGLVDRNVFMNYLYGLMFRRIAGFLSKTNSRAELIIDRNTDKMAQDSLKNYISDVTRYYTGSHPRHSKPKWINPEDDPILGMSDFISGVALRSWTDYVENVSDECKKCEVTNCMYNCDESNYKYKRSFRYIQKWNYNTLSNWDWQGLLYHPYVYKDNYPHLIQPK